jgi:RNA exonuclease 4
MVDSSGDADVGTRKKKRRKLQHESNWDQLRLSGKLRREPRDASSDKPGRSDRRDRRDLAPGTLTRALAIDCEMVGTGVGGQVSVLARVSIVNSNGHVVLDSYVSPSQRVTDFRTQFSGIRKHHLVGAPSKETVLMKVRKLVSGRILLGHAIHNDLEVLELSHPETHIRDSSKYPQLMRTLANGKLKPKALRVLAKEELSMTIQEAEHDSVQDARAVLALYKKHETAWEKWHQKTMKKRGNDKRKKCIEKR